MDETRLDEYLTAQYEALPAPENRMPVVVRKGQRRGSLKQAGLALAGAVAVVMVGIGWVALLGHDRAVAASPFSGRELEVIHETPVILQGELGPQPQVEPPGVNLTYSPIDEPTDNDLAAIEEVIQQNGYTDPVVVALGRIEAFDTNVYAIHNVDPVTRRGHSSVLGVGPDYPSFQAESGPTEEERWGPGATRGPDGDGRVFLRIPDYATWQYGQLNVDGEISWQRPSDGFIWIPFEANLDSAITLTAHDLTTGNVHLEFTLERISDLLDKAPPRIVHAVSESTLGSGVGGVLGGGASAAESSGRDACPQVYRGPFRR